MRRIMESNRSHSTEAFQSPTEFQAWSLIGEIFRTEYTYITQLKDLCGLLTDASEKIKKEPFTKALSGADQKAMEAYYTENETGQRIQQVEIINDALLRENGRVSAKDYALSFK